MIIAYTLLSPTPGMHQYTADYANRMAAAGHDVHVITTITAPTDRYAPNVQLHTPVTTSNTGLSRESLDRGALRAATDAIQRLKPAVVHITGPHLWNGGVMAALQRSGIPVIHTLHDLDPHAGTRYGRLLYFWNNRIARRADVILVHGQRYRERLVRQGIMSHRVCYVPLLHLFVGHAQQVALESTEHSNGSMRSKEPELLFFGRIAPYKGLDDLLAAYTLLGGAPRAGFKLTIAGEGTLSRVWQSDLPPGVTVENHAIDDAQAIAQFRRCSALVLPYTHATQSALVAAAYFFARPVLVTDSGALAEYVVPDETGIVVRPRDPMALADGLKRLFADDAAKLQKMGLNGRAWYDRTRVQEWRALQSLYARYQ